MAETVRVWVRTSAIEQVLFGKSKSSTKRRALPDALSSAAGDEGIGDWGWHRAELVRDGPVSDASKKNKFKSGSSVESDGKPIKVYIRDEDSSHDRSTIEIPPDLAKDGVVVDNNFAEDDDEDEDSIGGGMISREGPPDDLIHLTHLHEPAVVHCLRQRYTRDKIYTATGPILLALNPFKNCQTLYSERMMKKYRSRGERTIQTVKEHQGSVGGPGDKDVVDLDEDIEQHLPPHVYAIADYSFRSMMKLFDEGPLGSGGGGEGGGGGGRGRRTPGGGSGGAGEKGCDQSILVSGESGAGKTVTTKFIMKYLASLSQITNKQLSTKSLEDAKKGSTEQQVLQSNPILESFGNARTIRNDNSSRFGKFIELEFTGSGLLKGASIETYLLEKVRLVTQTPGERNYHIFYELLAGMEEEELEQYFIGLDTTAEDFRMTSASGTFDRRDGVDDYDTFMDLKEAMDTMGFEPTEQENMMTVTCAMLHSSNVTFLAIDADTSEIDQENPSLEAVTTLLGLTYDNLNKALCYFSIQAGKERHTRSLPKGKAEKGMEALIKATYGALFTWIVKKVNSCITVKDSSATARRGAAARDAKRRAKIGVLDIFGFESFKKNSFEQLCINYCNEALQQQFNLFVLKNEQDEYEREGIQWSFISFPENQDVLELIWKKGSGILNILDDQCRAPGTTDKTFSTDIYQKCTGHPRFQADFRQVGARLFGVVHYAGCVEYDTEGFVEKNRDELPREATDLLKSSSNPFVSNLAEIISGGPSSGCDEKKGAAGGSGPTTPARGGRRPVPRAGGAGGGGRGASKKTTVGAQFSAQLTDLRNKIDKTSPHYVRCLKPNDLLVPDHFDPVIIADQLRCAGVVEAVRVSRVGYPQRYAHANFVKRYRILGLKELKKASRSSSRRVKNCDVLVGAIAKQIHKVLNPEEEIPSSTSTKGKKNASSSSGSDGVDLMSVGVQVGKTKVFLRSQAYEIIEQLRAHKMDEASVRLQATFRRFLQQQEYKLVRISVIQLQCALRGKNAREEFLKLQMEHGATSIQTTWRKSTARHVYVQTVFMARWLQKVQRGRLGRRRYETLNRVRKAKVIQKCWRCHYHEKRYEKMKWVAWSMQCTVRCYFARQALKDLKAQARDLSAIGEERDMLRKDVQRLQSLLDSARKKAKEDAAKAASTIAKVQAEKKALQDSEEMVEMRKEAERMREELEKAKAKVEEEGARASNAESALKAAEEEIGKEKEESKVVRAELERVEANVLEVNSRAKVQEETLGQLRAEIKRMEDKSATAEQKAEADAKEIETLQEELEQAKNEAIEAQEAAEEAEEKLAAAPPPTPANNVSEHEVEMLQREIEHLTTELEEAKTELKNRPVKEVESSNANAASSPKPREEKKELNKLRKELETANDKLEVAQVELQNAKNELKESKRKLEGRPSVTASASGTAAAAASGGEKGLPQAAGTGGDAIPSVPMSDAMEEIDYLRSEIMRLEEELKSTKDVIDDPNSPQHLKARYDELRRLSEAALEKDEEIMKLKNDIKLLKNELQSKNVNGGHNNMNPMDPGSPPNLGDPGGADGEPDELPDDTSSLGFEDVTNPNKDPFAYFGRKKPQLESEAEDDSALKAVNEMLRNEVEQLRKELADANQKAKEEAEQSARDLEAFSEALRGVDEMRKAAEQMSRELNRVKRRNKFGGGSGGGNWETMSMRDDMSMMSGGTELFNQASRILDNSSKKADNAQHLWARVRSHVQGVGRREEGRRAGRRQSDDF